MVFPIQGCTFITLETKIVVFNQHRHFFSDSEHDTLTMQYEEEGGTGPLTPQLVPWDPLGPRMAPQPPSSPTSEEEPTQPSPPSHGSFTSPRPIVQSLLVLLLLLLLPAGLLGQLSLHEQGSIF